MPIPEKASGGCTLSDLKIRTATAGAWDQSRAHGNDFYINLEPENAEEAEQLFDKLSAGGEVTMPLEETEWAEQFGMCTDKYSIQWMVNINKENA